MVEDLCGLDRIAACKPPHVPVPKPGPCRGTRRAPGARARPRNPGGHRRAHGKDVLEDLDMATIGALPKRQGGRDGRWRSGQHDAQLAAIAAVQGFGGPPRLVDQAQFDRLASQPGAVALYRGVEDNYDARLSGDQIAAAFRHGPVFYGQGFSGNGIYAASDRDKALDYTSDHDPRAVNQMVLDPQARTIGYGQVLERMAAEIPEGTRQRLQLLAAAQRQMFEPGRRTADMVAKAHQMTEVLQPHDWLWIDPSAYAMARGYDAIHHGRPEQFPAGEWVLLNRTAAVTAVPDAPPRTLAEIYPGEFAAAFAHRRYVAMSKAFA